jgi:hypothetical protein
MGAGSGVTPGFVVAASLLYVVSSSPMRNAGRGTVLALAFGIGASVFVQRLSARDGREVIAEAQARNGLSTWRDRTSTVVLETFEAGAGRRREAEVVEQTDPHGVHRTRIDFTDSGDDVATRLLHVSPRGEPDTYWLWSPASRRVRRIGGNAGGSAHRDEIFTGTDMSYRELELIVRIQQWDDAAATATLEGEESVGGAACHRILLTPTRPNEFPLTRYRLWYGRDDLLLYQVELYRDDEALERVSCADYFARGRFMTPRRCEIRHLRTGVRAVVTFKEAAYDTGVADEVFSPTHLEESR